MAKTLKPYTIIPSELYVKRDADRQLKNIIEDMGRPGYVLVSRQMGKTNLLLNAKRESETSDDIFVYVDLSNTFPNEKDCFENIINTILEINEERLQNVAKNIYAFRKTVDTNLPAHKLHTTELKKILREIPGKLVIILDEIDALTKTKYSDRIFSQIRSIYFTRVNFPEFSRLTYILSGVVEPSDIIKDNKISPFNIGQKIFLNDFNFEEFNNFIQQAQLKLDTKTIDCIYSWTNGNPRISWDVCSEVESLNEENISSEDIDQIIKNIYLTEFDRPPIDNIREILKQDAELRNAIVEIEYNNGEKISDRIKSKLYLAGIINYNDGKIKIKNEVIRKAVNLKWISSINEEEKGLVQIAIEHFNNGEFAQSLLIFKRFLENNEFSSNASLYYYYMGFSAFKESQFEEAKEYLDKTDFDTEDETRFYYLSNNLKGLVYYYLGYLGPSLEFFKSVLARSKKDEIYARSLINFGSISLKSENSIHIREAKEIFENIIEEKNIDSKKMELNLLNELKTISYYNLGQIAIESGNSDLEEVRTLFNEAVEIAPEHLKPKILLASIKVLNDKTSIEKHLKELVGLLKNSSIKPTEFDPDQPMSFDFEQFKDLLMQVLKINNEDLYKELIKDLKSYNSKSIGENLYDIALHFLRGSENINYQIATYILEDLYNNRNNLEYSIENALLYKILKVLSYLTNPKEHPTRLGKYVDAFKNYRSEEINLIDLENFASYIYSLVDQNRFGEAFEAIDLIKKYKKEVSEQYQLNYLLIFNLELNLYLKLSNESKSKETAGQILLLAKSQHSHYKLNSNILNPEGVAIIKSNAETVLKPKFVQSKVINYSKKFNRNDMVKVRYLDGSIKTLKYKKVLNDLDSGLCQLIE